MNINRLNYENYFLLYVDQELSAAEMQAVESFAAENEDLADELNTLLQTKLPKENAYLFNNKSILFRTTATKINSINYEEQFLLFVDGELTEEEKTETLDFIAGNPNYQAIFESILQTKLPVETISFPDKESLLRKEPIRKPVIVIQWWKLAAAAALIGVIALISIMVPFHPNNTELVKTKITPQPVPTTMPSSETNNGTNNIIREQPIYALKTKKNMVRSTNTPVLNDHLVQPSISENSVAKTENPKQAIETIALNTNNPISSGNSPTIGNESNTHANQITAVNNRVQAAEEPSFVKPAVYKELDTDDERKSLYLGSVEINKDKLRGFLRKASSIFKVKNKPEEEKTDLSNSHTLE